MIEESDILRIVEEDMLRVLYERKGNLPLESVKAEIKASHSYISKAIEGLLREDLIVIEGNFVNLTKNGMGRAKGILEKHLVLEDYFKRTRSEEEAHKIAHILEHYVSQEVIKNIKVLSTFKGEGSPLTKPGLAKEFLITDITIPDNELFERIVSMGIFPGNRIKLTNEIPGGIIVRVKNKKFALDKEIAKDIRVLEHSSVEILRD